MCNGVDANGKDVFSLSAIVTQGAALSCSVPAGMCGAGKTEVSDIHNHPSSGPYTVTQADVNADPGRGLVVGQQVIIRPNKLSGADVSVNYSFNLNGWVIPTGSGKILYYDGADKRSQNQGSNPLHLEFQQ